MKRIVQHVSCIASFIITLSALSGLSGCTIAEGSVEFPDGKSEQEKSASKKAPNGSGDGASSSSSSSSSGPSGPNGSKPPGSFASLPDLTPIKGKRVSDPTRLWRSPADFSAKAPTIRANDRHASLVTGTDCQSCHGSAGPAPQFAFSGTIAAGKNWAWAPPGWRPPPAPKEWGGGGGYGYDDDYDDYGDYSYDDYGYDDYGYDDYDSYDDYGYGTRKKGWPSARNEPSQNTELRIVDSDGMVFEAVTDADGNFWYKSKAEVKPPAYTGVRNGTFVIVGRSNGMACGSCHENSANPQGRIWTWDGPVPRK